MKKLIFAIFSIIIFNSCVPLLLVGTGVAVGAGAYSCIDKDGLCNKVINKK